jgi:hypothetical protein
MKHVVLLSGGILICLLMSEAISQPAKNDSNDVRACPFNIIGLWRSEITTQSNPVLFRFSANGWVTLLSFEPERLPQDFEMLTEMVYQLDNPGRPKQLEFRASRGNDAFPPGVTLLKIDSYSDDQFTTVDHLTGQKIQWVREPSQRVFLTFAARRKGPAEEECAFVQWSRLDGRAMKSEALGVRPLVDASGRLVPSFAPIPAVVHQVITDESDRDGKDKKAETQRLRLELTEIEFAQTIKLFELWEKRLQTSSLPFSDPHQNQLEFMLEAVTLLTPCGAKTNLYKPTRREIQEIATKVQFPQSPFELVKLMRQKNAELHIDDRGFPWGWRPVLQSPARLSGAAIFRPFTQPSQNHYGSDHLRN